MGFDDTFRLSSHAVIINDVGEVLLLKANYGYFSWGLPGGALDPGETIHEALLRECKEELGRDVIVQYLSGVYYHSSFNSQAFIFRCFFADNNDIKLSDEHSDYKYIAIADLPDNQRQRIQDCINFSGVVISDKF